MDQKEFEKLFRENFNPLCSIANSMVRDVDTAQDIVQHVFIKLWKNLTDIKINISEKAYLHRAVVNTTLNHIEKNKRYQYRDNFIQFENVNASTDTEDEINYQELNREFEKAMNELSPKCQLIFSMSRFNGMTHQEIADYLHVSVKAIEKHMGKALKHLRRKLKPLITINLVIL